MSWKVSAWVKLRNEDRTVKVACNRSGEKLEEVLLEALKEIQDRWALMAMGSIHTTYLDVLAAAMYEQPKDTSSLFEQAVVPSDSIRRPTK